jgi:hypothetical protein
MLAPVLVDIFIDFIRSKGNDIPDHMRLAWKIKRQR